MTAETIHPDGDARGDTADFSIGHPIWLIFRSKATEDRFNDSWRKAVQPTNKIWASAASGFYIGMAMLLYLNWPDNFIEDNWFRLFVCMPLILMESAMAFRRKIQGRLFDAMYLIAALPAYGNAAIMYMIAPAESQMFYLLELALIYVFTISYYRVRFFRALIFAGVAGTIGGIAVTYVGIARGDTPIRIAFELMSVGALAGTTVFASHAREMMARHNYRDRQKAHGLMREAEKLAEAALTDARAKSRFMASVGQEFQAPVKEVLSDSSPTENEPISPDRAADYMTDIHDSARRLDKIIEHILQAADIDTSSPPVPRKPANLAELIDDALTAANVGIDAADLSVNIQHQDASAQVMVDRDLAFQMLGHVLSNAIKFSPRGAAVDIVTHSQDTRYLELRISDHGPGIPEDQIERVVEPFVQLDDELNRKYEGLGLGLAIAKRLAHRNGGTLEVVANPGAGTTICFMFRRAAAVAA